MKKTVVCLLLALVPPLVRAHEHLAVGATSSDPGATLVFQNAADFAGESGFVFSLTAGTSSDAYYGFYYTGDITLSALPATPDTGGPAPGAAALGTFIQLRLLSIDGPTGASFGFWESSADGLDSTNLSWSLPVPCASATNLIAVSESNGAPGSDPYGHIHGRIYSFTRPGLYRLTCQFVDTSSNGPAGGPVDLPSAPFSLFFQADLTVAAITPGSDGLQVTFATPANIPDSGVGLPSNYALESTPSVGTNSAWQTVGDLVVGDDHLHTVTVPATGTGQFFRLSRDH